MQKPLLDLNVADLAPADDVLTEYDEEHLVTYLRLLDGANAGADWREVSRIVLHRDPDAEPNRTRRAYDSHLERARWLSEQGYKGFVQAPG
ncbi:DNA -binding domain-containing protein [Bradyrhizobium oligotrophicum]|uniref:DNA -binding domain-containing protein n=1 Tax=Bradyrhizobium oligotrophicum TaxID=44255 RepID=UPI003EC004F0